MKYLLLIMGPPYGTQNSHTGFLFAKSILKLGHKLDSIFFYCDGVLNANYMVNFDNDEFNLVYAWDKLYNIYNIKLNVCVGAANRRGVVKSMYKNKNLFSNLNSCFKFTSLIELGVSLQNCDKCIQF